jgi:hypothetical protein
MKDAQPRSRSDQGFTDRRTPPLINILQPKTSTIVVDIGGGTTDLKSYTVIRTNPMRLSSACVGKGKMAPTLI